MVEPLEPNEENEETTPILHMRLVVKNNHLKEELERQGYTQMDLARKTHLCPMTISYILNLKRPPTFEQQIAIALVLKKPLDYLFPDALTEAVERGAFQRRSMTLDESQVRRITGTLPQMLTDGGIEEAEDSLDRWLLGIALKGAMQDLSENEREILMLRFGLADGEPRTLEYIGDRLGMTRERVRQQETRAIQKLERSRALLAFLTDRDSRPPDCTRILGAGGAYTHYCVGDVSQGCRPRTIKGCPYAKHKGSYIRQLHRLAELASSSPVDAYL